MKTITSITKKKKIKKKERKRVNMLVTKVEKMKGKNKKLTYQRFEGKF